MNKPLSLSRRLYLILILSVVSAVAQEPPRSLVPEAPIERELSGGQTHAYTIRLTANQIARVIAEQKGIDVIVSVIAPDGVKLFEVDSPNGSAGEEPATIAAQQNGLYRIEIRSMDKNATTGRYSIRLDKFLTESEYLTERLAALGRLWGVIKYFHPDLAYKDIDWDGALVRAIPQIKAARTPSEYRQAIGNLLQTLNDPATTIVPASIEGSDSSSGSTTSKAPTYFRIIDDRVIIKASDWAKAMANNDGAAFARQQPMMAEIAKAKGIVLDCRYNGVPTTEAPPYFLSFYLDNVLPFLVQGNILFGAERYRMHNGYAPQRGNTSGGYTSAFVTQAPGALVGQAGSKKPFALVIDEKTPDLTSLLSGLQASGAKVIQVGKSSRESSARTHQMTLADGVRARIRTTEFVHPNGGSTFQADAQMPGDSESDERVISTAIAALNNSAGERAATTPTPPLAPTMQSSKDAPYPQMSFPSEEYRLLALFRFWNVINYFFPYKHLTDKPWGTVLTNFIPRFLENKNQLDYEMTVAEMVAQLQDTHGFVGALRSLDAHLGGFAPPLSLRVASGKLTIENLLDEGAAQAAGVKVGDVIVAVDGEPVERRIAYLSRFKSLSTSASAYRYIYPTALRGAKDSKAKLRIEGADGQPREIEMPRALALGNVAFPPRRKTPIYQVLANGYGYIDLARLPLADAQKAMDAVMQTPGLIFDMRGYPNGTAWEIGPRLSEKKNFTVARFRRPFQVATAFGDEDLDGITPDFSFEQKMPPAKGAIYKGKVVVLINEDAISQSEHTCLFFEAATSVTFIGSPTNGANGDVTNLVLPGGIYVSFSGHDVRHADGRQLQRVGIQPHIKVEPTPKGIRDGRDEVFEAAVKYLDAELKK
jgi:C-terminal processing protease CtpA/Prc